MNELEVVKESIELAKDFIKMLAGPAVSEIGLYFQDQIKYFRSNNLISKIVKVQENCKKYNLTPNQIPLRTLIPLLDGASIEDNPELSEMWTNLITNTAIGKIKKVHHPSWAMILKQLSPEDALMFREVFNSSDAIVWESFKVSFAKKYNFTNEDVSFSFTNLMRLGLLYNTTKDGRSSIFKKNEFAKNFFDLVSSFEK